MFIVMSKEKIVSYVIAICTVFLLFAAANVIKTDNNTIQTSAGSSKRLPIYNVETDKKEVALTLNCAWNADDIDSILTTLKKHDTKVTFFMVGSWVDKFPEAVTKIKEAGHEIRKPFR